MVQREANPVAPGRRMRSSMSPVVGWRGSELVVLGGRGGARIPTGVAQALLAVVVDGEDVAAALARPRIHHQWLPDRLEAEADALAPETRGELERRGHSIVEAASTPKLTGVRRLAGGAFEAATDPRGPAPHGGAGVVVPEP
jgi:gamma-glutamyltranspeptidase/glutathione hydrolase